MAKFSKGQYVVLARALKETVDEVGAAGLRAPAVIMAAEKIADALKADNQAFDRSHFIAVVRGERPVNSRPASKACKR